MFFQQSSLFSKILLSFSLATVSFLTLLTIVVFYSNEQLEYDLLEKQVEQELTNFQTQLAQDSSTTLPQTAGLRIYLKSRQSVQPIPAYLSALTDGVYHDLKAGDKALHVVVKESTDDTLYLQYDITEIEKSEELLSSILIIAWILLLILVFIISHALSRNLSRPIARLNQEVSQLNPDQRGAQLSQDFASVEVREIANTFDLYLKKMDDYVGKQMAFAAMASHELRSPLTIIQTSADLISYLHDDESTQQHTDKIHRASKAMADLIHALLQVTRDIPTDHRQLQCALYPIVNEVIQAFDTESKSKHIEINNNLSMAMTVLADETLLTVIFSNLIKNAVKHGQNSQITIEMTGQTLSIIDTGTSISDEEAEHIFDFGYRGENSQGYGIGLYISKLICDYLGWSLKLVKNDVGGTTAEIEIV